VIVLALVVYLGVSSNPPWSAGFSETKLCGGPCAIWWP